MGETEEGGPSKEEIERNKPQDVKKASESGNRHSKKNARRRHPTARDVDDNSTKKAHEEPKVGVPQTDDDGYNLDAAAREAKKARLRFSRQASDELRDLDVAEGKKANASVEDRIDKEPVPLSPHELEEKISKNPVMQGMDYRLRDEAMAKVVDRFRDEPESAGFEELAKIFEAEENDLEAKKSELEKAGIEPYQAQWLEVKLDMIRTFQQTLNEMIRGKELKDNDDRVMKLNQFIREMHDQLLARQANAQRVTARLDEIIDKKRDALLSLGSDKDPQPILDEIDKLEENKKEYLNGLKLAGDIIPIFQALDDLMFDYGSDDFEEDEE